MSIQNEINRINQNVANTYSALRSMGATLPETQNSDNMASTVRTVPQTSTGGGDSAPDIFYVDGTFDMQTLTFSTGVTFAEIIEAVSNGKYIVAKAQAYMGNYNTNVIYLPVTSLDLMSSIAVFDGTMQVNGENIGLEKGLILLAVTVEISNIGKTTTRIKVVTTTAIK